MQNGQSRTWPVLAPVGLALLASAWAIQFQSYNASILLVSLALLACFVSPIGLIQVRFTRIGLFLAIWFLVPFWFAGFDTPPNWDAVQTVIRAHVFWDKGEMERFSLFYIVLSPFVGPFRSSIPVNLFTLFCGVVAGLSVAWGSLALGGKDNAFRIGILFFLLAPYFILYRFVMLDAWLVMLWALTLSAALHWSGKPTVPRLLTISLLTLLCALSKESGALIVIPVALSLVLLAPRRERKKRLLVGGGLMAAAVVIGLLVIVRYARVKNIDSYFAREPIQSHQGLTFLPAMKNLQHSWIGYEKILIRHHLFFWAQTGLIVPIVFAFFRSKNPLAMRISLVAGAAAQLYWMLSCRPDRWKNVYTYPYFDGNLPGKYLLGFFLFVGIVLLFWISGNFRFQTSRRAWISLVAILVPTIALHLFVKVYEDEKGYVHIWQAWPYLPGAAIGGMMLAAAGLRRLSRTALPRWLKMGLLAVVMITVMNSLVQGVGMGIFFRNHAMARLKAYEFLQTQPRRTVYTHWPFSFLGTPYANVDAGSMAWGSDGWSVRSLQDLCEPSYIPETGSLIVWDDFHSYGLSLERINDISREWKSLPVPNWRLSLFHPHIRLDKSRNVHICEVK